MYRTNQIDFSPAIDMTKAALAAAKDIVKSEGAAYTNVENVAQMLTINFNTITMHRIENELRSLRILADDALAESDAPLKSICCKLDDIRIAIEYAANTIN